MSRKNVEVSPLPENTSGLASKEPQHISIRALSLCALAFILCILVSVTPLLRLAGKTFLLQLPTNPLLLWWGSWLPANLNLAQTYRASMITTSIIEFLLIVTLMFGIYGLCAFLISRQPAQSTYKRTLRLIWLCTLVGGLIFVLTPAMLSRDIFVYAGYGRTIVAHHANPYFVPLSAFPRDPLASYDDWNFTTAAYGPAWLIISALWTLLLDNNPVSYVLAFRLFALAAHLLNTLLVITILSKMGRSPRTVTLGALLYAWNPLALEESCLGGHNDTFMITLILLGILLSIHAEQQNFARPSLYLPPVLVFTLAALVKFTALPLIALYLVFLARNTLYPSLAVSSTDQHKISPRWRSMLLKLLLAAFTGGLVAIAFYAPFWFGHSIYDIGHSFNLPPSARSSENSLMRAIFEWVKMHGLPARTSWTYTPLDLLSQRYVWDRINFLTLAGTLLMGITWIWRNPTTRTLALAALVTLGSLLIVTPWFFAWYVTWIVALAAVCLPASYDHKGRALIASALTFSVSAFVTYLFNGNPPLGGWSGSGWLIMVGAPLLVFFVFIVLKNKPELPSVEAAPTIKA